MSTPTNYFLQIGDVVKRYEAHTALDHVSMDVPQGCIYGLLGPNVAGKTSLLRIINQITHPDSGTVTFNGRPMVTSDVQYIGYLPEERGLYKKMKVGDEIIYLARLKGMPHGEAIAAMNDWLERFDLTEWRDKKVEQLSKGMAQKVQFIATVIHRPQFLIFDEPFSGFDPVNADQLKAEILRLRDEGATILFSTHNMESVESICEQITLINQARVVLQGRVDDIRQQHKKNVLHVQLNGGGTIEASPLYDILPPTVGLKGVCVKLREGVTMREAVATLNEQYDLAGFSEILPSMHEIFVETVNATKRN